MSDIVTAHHVRSTMWGEGSRGVVGTIVRVPR